MPLCKALKGVLKVKTTVQCISPTTDLSLSADPGQTVTIPVVIKTNSVVAVPLTIGPLVLTPANADVVLATTAGIASPKAETPIDIKINVGANSAGGDFTIDSLNISY